MANPPLLGRALTAPDECFPQMKQFSMKQMPKTTPGYSVAVWKEKTPDWGAACREVPPVPVGPPELRLSTLPVLQDPTHRSFLDPLD